MVVILKLTRKVWSLDIVSRSVWIGAALWCTRQSALKGWQVERRVGGFRLTTPLIGVGWCATWDRREHDE